ncbi:hypothetical protein ABEU20_002756 [Rhodococcus sp. PAM 2766]|uniref:Uncharacterized protein n=1 Tax=Rhodococcus parequi TaxID=3137122 RepID=A0ABW9FF81_9NOCA
MAPQMDVTDEAKANETTTSEAPTSTTEAPTTATEVPSSTSPTSTTLTPPATTTPETIPTTTESTTAPTTAPTTAQTTTGSIPTTTTTASHKAAGQIDLGDGLSAKLVDDKVVVFDDGAEQCSASVAGAANIADRGDGKLAVTDSDGKVHYVDSANCAIS